MYLLVAIVVFLLGTDACVRSRAVVRLTCPRNRVTTSDKRSTSAMVQWGREDFTVASTRPIKAIIQTVPEFGPSVNVRKPFIEGTHYIEYKAVDDGGNFQSCSFSVTVKVVRCTRLHNPQFGLLTCDADNLYGSKCAVSCIPGYSIVGPHEVVCKRDGTWSQDIPFCRTTTCPDPGTPLHGTRLCTTGTHAYGSICSFSCSPGYQMVGEMRLICKADGSHTDWSAPTPSCKEITPPALEKCSSNIQVTTSSVLTEVQRPAVIFRTGDGSVVPSTCTYFGAKEAHNFTLGTHHITCKAFDPTFGEDAVSSCRFVIRIKPNPCRTLVQPLNGLLLCSMAQREATALHTTTCKLFCNKGYALARSDGPGTATSTFTCDHTGTWQPTHRVPSCVRPKRPQELNLPSEMYYTSSNCSASRDLSDVRIKFQSALQATIRLQNGCIMSPGNCLVEGVTTTCKVRHDSRWRRFVAGRHRKHILASAESDVERSAKRRRDAASSSTSLSSSSTAAAVADPSSTPPHGFVLPIQFHFATRIPEIGGKWPDEYHNAHSRLLAMFDYFERVVLQGAFTIRYKVTRVAVEEIKDSLTFAPVQAICDVGYKFNRDILLCVPCGAGTYYDFTIDKCEPCSMGFYQNEDAQVQCKRCPPGTASVEEGAVNVTQCFDIDECESSPCHNGGNCIDGHNSYSCICLPGYTGKLCAEQVYDCSRHACQNGGSCVAHSRHNYSCQCGAGYTGMYCQFQTVHGGWSPWSEWSECSRSCEGGAMSRNRKCNSPEPGPGGRDCKGSKVEMRVCNDHKCPACKRLRRPYKGTIECQTFPELEFIRCTLSCYSGHAFTAPVFPVYECGKNTSYLWPHQSPDNPRCVLPACTRISPATEAQYMFRTQLPLYCPSPDRVGQVLEQINTRATDVTRPIKCLDTGSCSLEEPTVKVTGCSSNQRHRRETGLSSDLHGVEIQVVLVYRGTIASTSGETTPEYTNTEGELAQLLKELEQQTLAGEMYIQVGGHKVRVDPNVTTSYSALVCPLGAVESPDGSYCVECSPGSFYNSSVGGCSLCEEGEYQPLSAQTFCHACPLGQTTYGRGALIQMECYERGTQPPSVPDNWEDYVHCDCVGLKELIPSVIMTLLVTAIIALITYIFIRKRNKREYDIKGMHQLIEKKSEDDYKFQDPEIVRLCKVSDQL